MSIRRELRPMLLLALPLVLGELGWMTMGLVDTAMVGRLPDAPTALAAASLAQVLFNTFAIGLGGVLLGLDTVIAQAHGAGKLTEAHRWLVHGLVLAVALSVLLVGLFLLAPLGLAHMHAVPAVRAQAISMLRALTFGVLPLLVYFCFRRYLQAFNLVRPIAFALISANLINLLFNWLLIYSHDWRPGWRLARMHLRWQGLGVFGSGLATSLARVYLALVLAAAIWFYDRRHRYGLVRVSLRLEWSLLRRLLALGIPSGATIVVEIAIFCVVTFAIGLLGAVPLAGHEVALNCISFTFMVPLGISAAAGVRVGQAIGRSAPAEARAAGWTALLLAGAFMLAVSALYLSLAHPIARLFTADEHVIAATVPLFAIAALFQLCDGLQITVIGALRGAGDTHSGLLIHLCTYWLIGLPTGLYLGFTRHLGARGLWFGLCTALVLAGALLLLRWTHVSRNFTAAIVSNF